MGNSSKIVRLALAFIWKWLPKNSDLWLDCEHNLFECVFNFRVGYMNAVEHIEIAYLWGQHFQDCPTLSLVCIANRVSGKGKKAKHHLNHVHFYFDLYINNALSFRFAL